MPKDDQIRARMEPDEKRAVTRKARKEGIPLSELIRRLLREWRHGRIKTPPGDDES